MKIVLLGAPGAGKGTQAKRIQERFDIPHLSAGDILRDAVFRGTAHGREAEGFMNNGRLVPDELVLAIIQRKIKELGNGFILDGFPRTIFQAKELDSFVDLDAVISIDVPFDQLLERLTGRRSCPACGAVFHIVHNPPEKMDICDACDTSLIQRADDNKETVKSRLDTYLSMTQPLVQYYQEKSILFHVDGNTSIHAIAEEIEALLSSLS